MKVPVKIYGSFPACESSTCSLQRACANHTSAGDFRSEHGVRPELEALDINDHGEGFINCKTFTTNASFDEYGDLIHPQVDYGECVWVDEISTQRTLF